MPLADEIARSTISLLVGDMIIVALLFSIVSRLGKIIKMLEERGK